MGLLDDAIREHLDLKRRRGGDPAEIERAEREALGPVRRRGENTTPEDADSAAAEPVGSAYDEPDDAVAGDLAEESPSAFVEPDTASEPAAPAPASGRPSSVDDDEPFEDDEPFTDEQPAASAPADEGDAPPPEHEPATRVMRAADIPTPGDVTAEYDVERALADETEEAEDAEEGAAQSREAAKGAPDEDEDMLEETPEFLQDTPDHDRLWFEQRPPRDFDFDG